MTELKPCPFCGKKVRFNYNMGFEMDGIWCSTCHMMVKYPRIHMKPKETFGEYEARMAEVWNRREEYHGSD